MWSVERQAKPVTWQIFRILTGLFPLHVKLRSAALSDWLFSRLTWQLTRLTWLTREDEQIAPQQAGLLLVQDAVSWFCWNRPHVAHLFTNNHAYRIDTGSVISFSNTEVDTFSMSVLMILNFNTVLSMWMGGEVCTAPMHSCVAANSMIGSVLWGPRVHAAGHLQFTVGQIDHNKFPSLRENSGHFKVPCQCNTDFNIGHTNLIIPIHRILEETAQVCHRSILFLFLILHPSPYSSFDSTAYFLAIQSPDLKSNSINVQISKFRIYAVCLEWSSIKYDLACTQQ